MSEEMPPVVAVKFQAQDNTLKRHETYFNQIWVKLDRLPRWASIVMTIMGTIIGALTSSLLHILMASGGQ